MQKNVQSEQVKCLKEPLRVQRVGNYRDWVAIWILCVTQEMSVTQERIWLFVCLFVGFFFTCRKPQMHLIKTVQLWIRWVSKALLCQYPISIFPFQQPYISFWIGWENLSMFWWGNTHSLLSFFLIFFHFTWKRYWCCTERLIAKVNHGWRLLPR